MIYPEKDPTFRTFLVQEALKARGLYDGDVDNWEGDKTKASLQKFRDIMGPVPREVNSNGLTLVKYFEGCYLHAYKDSVGVWTIGYGHTGLTHRDGSVHAGRTITLAEAEELLAYDLRVFAKRVQDGTDVEITDDQFAALVSFDFNTGGFLKSTLRKKLNAGDYKGAADQLLQWDKAGGKKLKGLTRRRQSERNLFLGITPFIVG